MKEFSKRCFARICIGVLTGVLGVMPAYAQTATNPNYRRPNDVPSPRRDSNVKAKPKNKKTRVRPAKSRASESEQLTKIRQLEAELSKLRAEVTVLQDESRRVREATTVEVKLSEEKKSAASQTQT